MKKIVLALFFISFSFSLNTNSLATVSSLSLDPVPQIQNCFTYSVQAADLEWTWFYGQAPLNHSNPEWTAMQVFYLSYCLRQNRKGVEALLPVFMDL